MIKEVERYPVWAYYKHKGDQGDSSIEFTHLTGRQKSGTGSSTDSYSYDHIIKIETPNRPIEKRFKNFKKQSVYYGPAVEENWTLISRMTKATKRQVFERIFG